MSTLGGEKTLVDKQIGPIVLHEQGKLIMWDYAMYHLVRIYVILGLDWLAQNHAILDCKMWQVYLSLDSMEEGKQLFFHGEEVKNHQCIISYVKATKYLLQRCQGFLTSMVEVQGD